MSRSPLAYVAFGFAFPLVLAFLGTAAADPPAADDLVFADRLLAIADFADKAAALEIAPWTIDALAATLATPEDIRAYVRDVILPSPYEGHLRNPADTIAYARGSSLDRALLVAALLKAKGLMVRLASAPFDGPGAAAFAAPTAHVRLPAEIKPDVTPLIAELAADPRLAGIDIAAAIAAAPSDPAPALEARAAKLAPALIAALGPAWGDAPAPAFVPITRWWAEIEQDGAWTAIDPAADISPTPTATATMAPDALPAGEAHAVTFRVIAIVAPAGAAPTESALLEHRLIAADLDGEPLAFDIVPMALGGMPPVAADAVPAETLAANLKKATAWLPILTVGRDALRTQFVTLAGAVVDASDAEIAPYNGEGTGAAIGGAGGVLGGLAEDIGGGPAAPGLLALRLEIVTERPGAPPHFETRWLADIRDPQGNGPAAALDDTAAIAFAAALTRTASLAIWTATPTPGILTRNMTPALSGQLRIAAAILKGETPSPDLAAALRRSELPLQGLARLRATGDARIDVTAPNIALLWLDIANGPGGLTALSVWDIAGNDIAAVTREDRLTQGVRDTLGELIASGSGDVLNAAAAFEADLAAGKSWTPIANDVDALARGASPDVALRIAATLSGGAVILAPPSFARGTGDLTIYWRIDPVTGATLGLDGAGRGATADYVNLLARVVQVGACVGMFSAFFVDAAYGTGGRRAAVRAVSAALCAAAGSFSGMGTIVKLSPPNPAAWASGTYSAISAVISAVSALIAVASNR